jgi:hypothetical protein
VVVMVLKVTNDPLVSNLWLFYSPAEEKAMVWTDENVENSSVLVDVWPHLFNVLQFEKGYTWTGSNSYEFLNPDAPAPPYILVSERVRLEAVRKDIVLPATIDRNRVFDNGAVRLYHRRPLTPYQR